MNYLKSGVTMPHISVWILSILILVIFSSFLDFHSAFIFILISVLWLFLGISFLVFVDSRIKTNFNIYCYELVYGPIFWIFSFSAVVVGSVKLIFNILRRNEL